MTNKCSLYEDLSVPAAFTNPQNRLAEQWLDVVTGVASMPNGTRT